MSKEEFETPQEMTINLDCSKEGQIGDENLDIDDDLEDIDF